MFREFKYILLAIGCGLWAVGSMAQSMVFLEHSETLSFDEARLPDVQILKGNVCFRHDSVLMYCDSAYFFENIKNCTDWSTPLIYMSRVILVTTNTMRP